MYVIPLFHENRFIMSDYSGHYTFGSLFYTYSDDCWSMKEYDGALYTDITCKVRRPQWPRESPFWGLDYNQRDRYKRIFWGKAEREPKRWGPRWFRYLLVNDNRILVRDLIYGGLRKRCELQIIPNWWKRWLVYEPMSCKRTWPKPQYKERWSYAAAKMIKYDIYRKGLRNLSKRYLPNFGYELEASCHIKAGYPIEHGGMHFTPFYYELRKSPESQTIPTPNCLHIGFYTVQNGEVKQIIMLYYPDMQQVLCFRGKIDRPYPNIYPRQKGDISTVPTSVSVSPKANMNVLTDILRSVPIEYLKQL